jgi:hypothetical protein
MKPGDGDLHGEDRGPLLVRVEAFIGRDGELQVHADVDDHPHRSQGLGS